MDSASICFAAAALGALGYLRLRKKQTATHYKQELIDTAKAKFKAQFGEDPTLVVVAPGRVNLIGEHTDYCDGFVFPMALDMVTVVVAKPAAAGQKTCRLVSTNSKGLVEFEASSLAPPESAEAREAEDPKWGLYVKGAVSQYKALAAGKTIAFDAAVSSDVPLGGGLSSSASLEVAVSTLVEELLGTEGRTTAAGKTALAKRCQAAEHEWPGVPCGIMDQFISALGERNKALLINCRDNTFEGIPLNVPHARVLITNSNVKHNLGDSEYPLRVAACKEAVKTLCGAKALKADLKAGTRAVKQKDPGTGDWTAAGLRDLTMADLEAAGLDAKGVTYRRAKHVITENQRCQDAAGLLRAAAGKPLDEASCVEFGKLMHASHCSLRDDYEVTGDGGELDALVAIAMGFDGVYGSRMTGGGFGGCTVTLVKADRVDALQAHLKAEYKKQKGLDATCYVSTPAPGAHIVA